MFELSLIDHLRLTFGHIVYRQKAHSQIAYSRSIWGRVLRGVEALFMVGVIVTSVAAASGRGHGYVMASAVLAGLSLITLLVHLTFNIDASVRAHASSAARLWQMREQYSAILSDLHDGAIDANAARHRRDALALEMHDFLEHAPAVAAQTYGPADQGPIEEPRPTDQQIDVFLPESLHKARGAV
jgi:hypothetical protein